jgi:phage baseplate assembly protein V
MNIVALSRLIENLIRIGKIEQIDLNAKRCRVRTGNLLTQWRPWLSLRAGTTRTWNPPTIGEQVLIFSPSGELAGGIVLTGIESAEFNSPSNSADEDITDYPDGAQISYNHATGKLIATGIKNALIKASLSVTVNSPVTHCTGKVIIDGDAIIGGISFLGHIHTDPQGGEVGVPQ